MTRGLPEVSGARLKRALERAGFVEVHTRGSHCKLRHPERRHLRRRTPRTPLERWDGGYSPRERAMRMRMTSLVPSPISRTLASR
ncbi:MAG TPA: type II toxin-antitoxin system HicA family toxin [Actinomycetes bacterium]|nr:type II toxin-antitoxin system HicA family toxin [Actinomycetes bacterium]